MAGQGTPRKVIVAVHGIGDQTRYATIQQVLAQFAKYHGQAAAVPLGSFHNMGEDSAIFIPKDSAALSDLGFAEVYWADIPRKVVDQKYVLEDTKPWVRTIIGRIHQRQMQQPPPEGVARLTPDDERMIEQVLGEMLQTVGVLERLCYLADKMGVFSFDLKKILVDFIHDVQVVAEFKEHGGKIGEVFAGQMQKVHDKFPDVEEIYIVAHSEGTVVTLLGLLSALCKGDKPWISKVRGVMTLGSPIDKHLVLWPELFEELKEPCRGLRLSRPIEWHNYYDYGDPVGFELDTARKVFTNGPWKEIFNFPGGKDGNDHGFARYPLPGKAHNDYWQDEEVFGHFIRNVVYKEQPPPKSDDERHEEAPRSKALARVVSWVAPYLAAAALLFCAVLVLYKSVRGYIDPEAQMREILPVFATVAGIGCLLAGLTVFARIPRLTRRWTWRLFGFAFFLASILGYRFFSCLPASAADAPQCAALSQMAGWRSLGLAGAAIVLAIGIYFASKLFPTWGMRTLLIPGSIAVTLVVLGYSREAEGNLWPVFLAGAAFLYLWWLAALLFDLTFVWHRYIRMSVSVLEYRPEEATAPASLRKEATAAG